MANDKFIEDITGKLQDHASDLNPQMWSAISTQLNTAAGAAASSAAASTFGVGKVAAILIGTAAISVASYFVVTANNTNENQTPNTVVSDPEIVNDTEQNALGEEKTESVSNSKVPVEAKVRVESKRVDQTKLQEKAFVAELPPVKTEAIEIRVPMVTEPIRRIEPSIKSKPVIGSSDDKRTSTAVQTTESKLEIKESYSIINLPNTFTPNGDGVNDYFQVKTKGLFNYSLVVLDKNNVKVWQTTDPDDRWDGTSMSGEKVEKGEYIYFLAADGPNGEKVGKYQKLIIQ